MGLKRDTSKKERIRKLEKLIEKHQRLYYDLDAPKISDEAYDSLVRELKDLEQSADESVESITNRVGGKASEAFSKVTHKVRQWSFNNVFNDTELREWSARLYRHLESEDVRDRKLSYVAEHKIDGLKIVLEYKEGHLVRASTRGNGVIGEDVTHTARTIKDIPEKLPFAIDLYCVGEVWLPTKEFERINSERKKNGEVLFANPRNAGAGSLRQLDPEVARSRNLKTYIYDIDFIDPLETNIVVPKTQEEELSLLKKLKFSVNQHSTHCKDIDEVLAYYRVWEKKKDVLSYGVDGVVVKVNECEIQKALGYTAKAPRYGIAFKFASVEATTVVEDILLQVGRTGVITPVAKLSPVLVAGSTVSRATLHNEDFINELDIRVGDTVVIKKAGDIIPEVLEVLLELRPKNTKPFRYPKRVPECGGDGSIERVPGQSAYRCVVKESDFLHRHKLYYFVSKQGLNIDGVGPKIIDLLLEHDLISTYEDLFTLEEGDLIDLPGFKEKAAQNVIEAVNTARVVPLERLLTALSIEHVGEETARIIAEHFGSLEQIQEATLDEISDVYGVGAIVARSLYTWLQNKKNMKVLSSLLKHIRIAQRDQASYSKSLEGKTLVLTGSLPTLGREEAKAIIRQAGGKIASTVSKHTDFVVVGENPGTKYEQAIKLNITRLTEAELKKLINI